MAKIIRSDQAQQDLEAILDYLDGQSTQATDRFASAFNRTCDLHARNPRIGEQAEHYAPALRHFTVWSYAVFYRPVEDGIEIIRIIHGARDIPMLFE